MKHSYTTTFSRSPKGELEELGLGELLGIVSASFQTHKLGLKYVPIPRGRGLADLFSGEKRDRIAKEVSKCTRMVAFVSYNPDQVSVEISFSEGKNFVKSLIVIYDFDSRQSIFISENTL